MSDASSLQDFSKIFSLPSSESLVQSSYPEALSKKFSSRACLRFGIVTDDKNWISSSPTKVISDAILFVFLCTASSQHTRVFHARDGAIISKNSTFVFFDGASPITENGIQLRSPSPIMAPDFDYLLKRWCSIKEIEVYLLCEILTSKDTLQGPKNCCEPP